MNRKNNLRNRRGTVSTEMALVVPFIFLLFFGLWEWSRVEMVKHVCETAAFEGARHGTLPGATVTSTESRAQEVLDRYMIRGGSVSANLDAGTGASTVTLSVPVNENSLVGYGFFAGKTIELQATLQQ